MEPDEKFCSKCGHKILSRAERFRAVQRQVERAKVQIKVNRGRSWILIVACVTLLGGLFTYFMQRQEVEKQIHAAEVVFGGLSEEERDEQLKEAGGMSWEQMVDHERGMVTFLLVGNLILSASYFGLWWWAQKNPFAAALIALLLFITAILISAAIDPTTVLKGFILKAFVVIALLGAVSGAYSQRTMRLAPRRR
jgi:hypothetical protein